MTAGATSLYCASLADTFRAAPPMVVAGAGEVFRKKIRPALEHLGVRRFAVHDPAYDGPDALPRLEDAPAGAVAFVLSPNRFHVDQAVTLIERGVSVYLEKPIGLDRADTARLRAAANRRADTRVYCGDYYFSKALPLRALFAPERRFARWLDGEPGAAALDADDVVAVEGRLHEGGDAPSATLARRPWLADVASGGGMLLDLMVHLTNILETLGLRLTHLDDCRLYRHADGEHGVYQPLLSSDRCEDRADAVGRLNGTVPATLSVAKYAAAHDRWLRLRHRDGRVSTLTFDAANTLEVEHGGQRHRACLRVDPYLHTLHEALTFLSDSTERGMRYWDEQSASVALAERMKELYWGRTEPAHAAAGN